MILLLHGFGQFWWSWRHVLPRLDDAGFSVAAMDLRGYGDSDKTPQGYDPATTALDVSGVIKSLGHPSAMVIGHDWGGLAGWATTTYAPAQVSSLVAVAAPHPSSAPWFDRPGDLLPGWSERRLSSAGRGGLEHRLRSVCADPGLLSATEMARYQAALSHWPAPRCALQYQRTLAREHFRTAGRAYRTAAGQGTAVPVLSIRGALDLTLDTSHDHALKPLLHGIHEFVELPGVGHLIPEEAPEALSSAVISWASLQSAN